MYLPSNKQPLNQTEIHMSNFVGSCMQKIVAASVAVAMTGLLALSVIDSTTSGPVDQDQQRRPAPDLSDCIELRSAIPPEWRCDSNFKHAARQLQMHSMGSRRILHLLTRGCIQQQRASKMLPTTYP